MKISRSLIVNAPSDAIWKVLAHDFHRISEWASGISHSVINPAAHAPADAEVGGRICTIPGMGQLHESFTSYDNQRKTYTYEAKGMPFFVTAAHNTWNVEAVDSRTSRVSFQAQMDMMPVIGWLAAIPMRIQLNTLMDNAVEELKYYSETGRVHPRKQQLLDQQRRPSTAS